MSVVIVGGNERMERRYKDLCEDFQCRAKVFTKPRGGLRDKVGSPDLMIFLPIRCPTRCSSAPCRS